MRRAIAESDKFQDGRLGLGEKGGVVGGKKVGIDVDFWELRDPRLCGARRARVNAFVTGPNANSKVVNRNGSADAKEERQHSFLSYDRRRLNFHAAYGRHHVKK
jgi:hypothetical protein